MSLSEDLNKCALSVQQKLKEVYGISGHDLRQSLSRARRVLPRYLRKAGREIAQAQDLAGHPKLERMIDMERLIRIQANIDAHLDAVNVADLRRGRILTVLGRIAGYILIVGGAFISWMVWAGHL